MSHIIGRGRYSRETYPKGKFPDLGCALGVGADANEGTISLLASGGDLFLFPRQQAVQGNPIEVVLTEFNLGDALLIRYRVEWAYDPQSIAAPTEATGTTEAVVNLGSGYQRVLQAVGTVSYSGSTRTILQQVGNSSLIAGTAGNILFTPAAFTALPRVAILTDTDVPVDASNPVLKVGEDAGPAFLDVSRIKAGACVFQEPAFALSAPLSTNAVPFGP